MANGSGTAAGDGGQHRHPAGQAAGAAPPGPFIRLGHVSKSFEGNEVLRGVDLSLARGEVHALLGANGSGKSTLIKIITGYHAPAPGATAWLDSRPASFTRHGLSPSTGPAVVTRAVHQDLGLIGRFSAVDNTAMVTGYAGSRALGRIKWRRQVSRTRELLSVVGLRDLDVHKPVDDCEPLQRTQIALARALADWDGADGLLILDEPTASLPDDQVQHLFAIIGSLRARGITVLYVSHRLSEIFEVADSVTVLRAGEVVAAAPVAALTRPALVELIMGAPDRPDDEAGRPAAPAAAAVSLDSAGPPPGRNGHHGPQARRRPAAVMTVTGLRSAKLHGVSFQLGPGEALGFAGLIGSGLQELPYLLVGSAPAADGLIRIGHTSVPARKMTPLRATALGVGLVPGDRMREGLIGSRPVSENISLPQVRRFQRRGRLRRKDEHAFGQQWVGNLGITPADARHEVRLLSGGNQQKVLLAKWLGVSSALLIAAEPTAGVDVAAKELIYQELIRQRDLGLPMIICSTDLTDLVRTCTRVIALADGHAVGEFVGGEISEDNILRAVLHRDAARQEGSQRP
jgi:ABC-type sugar transport system ATPase subunit